MTCDLCGVAESFDASGRCLYCSIALATGVSKVVVIEAVKQLQYRYQFGSTTDLDRLHDVVLGNRSERGCGHTFAHCHEVASLIQLGEKDVLILLPSMRWISRVLPMLRSVLAERGVGELEGTQRNQHEFRAMGSRIRFTSSSKKLIGFSGPVVEVLG